MDKQTLSNLFEGKLFFVPDYQRGYAWKKKQWDDFIDDIDELVTDPHIKAHYTGTVVTFTPPDCDMTYNRKAVKRVDVVDGQQRITTSCLYLSVIMRALIDAGEEDYQQDIPLFLYHGNICKLTLNNDTDELFLQLLKDGYPRTDPETDHQKRLCAAVKHFADHIRKQLADSDRGVEFVRKLFEVMTGKLVFTYYTIEEECEIGMTFELMNSRGKGLSVLELLKNYFMHWISKNGASEEERQELTTTINRSWRDTYVNVGSTSGNESQCLRIAWTMFCHHLPKRWQGYDGFKEDSYFPLRCLSHEARDKTRQFLIRFADGLAEISHHYAIISCPRESVSYFAAEYQWLTRIHNTGNIANFLPLMVAARIKYAKKEEIKDDYLSLLKALECYAYRVFLFAGKRSNAGKSSFYRWSKELFDGVVELPIIIERIYGLIPHYAPEKVFTELVNSPFRWYSRRHLLKYTLFEYEQYLLDTESKGQKPLITWRQLAGKSTIEHILPQTPPKDSRWAETWNDEDIAIYLHDIGNLVLTRDNSSYLNFEFDRKKGSPGDGVGYCNSDIRQERKIASHTEWSVESVKKRKTELVHWILNRWGRKAIVLAEEIDEDEDEDLNELQSGERA